MGPLLDPAAVCASSALGLSVSCGSSCRIVYRGAPPPPPPLLLACPTPLPPVLPSSSSSMAPEGERRVKAVDAGSQLRSFQFRRPSAVWAALDACASPPGQRLAPMVIALPPLLVCPTVPDSAGLRPQRRWTGGPLQRPSKRSSVAVTLPPPCPPHAAPSPPLSFSTPPLLFAASAAGAWFGSRPQRLIARCEQSSRARGCDTALVQQHERFLQFQVLLAQILNATLKQLLSTQARVSE